MQEMEKLGEENLVAYLRHVLNHKVQERYYSGIVIPFSLNTPILNYSGVKIL